MLCFPFFFRRKRTKVTRIADEEKTVSAAERITENPEPCEATVATTSRTTVGSRTVAWEDQDNRDVSVGLTPDASTTQLLPQIRHGRWKRFRKQLLRCSRFFRRKRTKVTPIADEEETVSAAERHTEDPEVTTESEFERLHAKFCPVFGGPFAPDSRITENPEPCEATVATTSETTVGSRTVAWEDQDNRDVSVGLTPAASTNQFAETEKQHNVAPVSSEQGQREEAQTEGVQLVQSLVRERQLVNRGLTNFGYNCYVNATLQCLFSAESFCTQLSRQIGDWFYAPEAELIRWFLHLWWARKREDWGLKCALLREFIRAAAASNPDFTEDTPNDAHKFLFHCLGEMRGIGQMLSLSGLPYECPVRAHFEFQLVRVTTCGCYGAQKGTVEELNHLSLALPPRGSVRDCLNLFFSSEEETECRCEVCMHHSASCWWVVRTLPRILVLRLKKVHMSAATIQKQHNQIDIDTKLQLRLPEQSCSQEATQDPHEEEAAPCQSVHTDTPPNGQQNPEERRTERSGLGDSVFNYSLISVMNHHGDTVNSGHYTSDCYSQSDSCWLSFDDQNVTVTTEERVLKQRRGTAYLLFYERN